MARRPRIEFQGALYHIITRGNQRQRILRGRADYQKYLQILENYIFQGTLMKIITLHPLVTVPEGFYASARNGPKGADRNIQQGLLLYLTENLPSLIPDSPFIGNMIQSARISYSNVCPYKLKISRIQ